MFDKGREASDIKKLLLKLVIDISTSGQMKTLTKLAKVLMLMLQSAIIFTQTKVSIRTIRTVNKCFPLNVRQMLHLQPLTKA